jgi:hypothetical protein
MFVNDKIRKDLVGGGQVMAYLKVVVAFVWME